MSSFSQPPLNDPLEAGRRFVFDEVMKVVEEKALPVFGDLISSDIIIGFIDRYYSLIGLPQYGEKYGLAEIERAMENHLIDVCSRIIWNQRGTPFYKAPLNLDQILLLFGDKYINGLEQPPVPIQFSITSDRVPIRPTFSGLEFLKFRGTEEVIRVFPIPDYSEIEGSAWIWQGYSHDDEVQAITHILSNIIEEYRIFISGNRLLFPNSPYLDPATAIIYQYEPVAKPDQPFSPTLREFHIENSTGSLPKCLVIVKDPQQEESGLDMSAFPKVQFQSSSFTAIRASHRVADSFFQPCPVVSLIYKMLEDDLNLHFDID